MVSLNHTRVSSQVADTADTHRVLQMATRNNESCGENELACHIFNQPRCVCAVIEETEPISKVLSTPRDSN